MKDKDLIEKYIIPGMVERAPEGFTQKVMTRVLFEKAPNKKVILWKRIRVPVAVLTVALALIILSVVLLSPSDNVYITGISNVMNGVSLKLPAMNEGLLNNLKIPGIVIYLSVGILFLSLFDFGLNRLFRRRG